MHNNFAAILGDRLITISDVHKATRLSRSTLTSIYYRRSSSISFSTIVTLCDYLQIPMHDLIDYEPKNAATTTEDD